ncbi:MAG: hypothetical protein AB7O97_20490 [Planctomycetota bacterium]
MRGLQIGLFAVGVALFAPAATMRTAAVPPDAAPAPLCFEVSAECVPMKYTSCITDRRYCPNPIHCWKADGMWKRIVLDQDIYCAPSGGGQNLRCDHGKAVNEQSCGVVPPDGDTPVDGG